MTKDHQLPKSKGGRGKLNLVMACHRCNSQKSDMDVEAYRRFLQQQKAVGERVVFYGETCPQPWFL